MKAYLISPHMLLKLQTSIFSATECMAYERLCQDGLKPSSASSACEYESSDGFLPYDSNTLCDRDTILKYVGNEIEFADGKTKDVYCTLKKRIIDIVKQCFSNAEFFNQIEVLCETKKAQYDEDQMAVACIELIAKYQRTKTTVQYTNKEFDEHHKQLQSELEIQIGTNCLQIEKTAKDTQACVALLSDNSSQTEICMLYESPQYIENVKNNGIQAHNDVSINTQCSKDVSECGRGGNCTQSTDTVIYSESKETNIKEAASRHIMMQMHGTYKENAIVDISYIHGNLKTDLEVETLRTKEINYDTSQNTEQLKDENLQIDMPRCSKYLKSQSVQHVPDRLSKQSEEENTKLKISTRKSKQGKKENARPATARTNIKCETKEIEQNTAGFHLASLKTAKVNSSEGRSSKYTGVVCLKDGRYILTDENNRCIVLLSQSLQIQNKLRFDSAAKPWNLLQIGDLEVATALRYDDDDYDQIVFIKINKDKLKISRKINLPYECLCIQSLSGGNLLVSARNDYGNWILIEISEKGIVRRKITKTNGHKLEKMKRYVVSSLDTEYQIMYHVTYDNKTCTFKTIGLDGQQNNSFTYTSEEQFDAGDFCTDNQENIYVCNKIGANIHILTNQGCFVAKIDNICQPTCVGINQKSEMTVVSRDGTKNFIHQFHIQFG